MAMSSVEIEKAREKALEAIRYEFREPERTVVRYLIDYLIEMARAGGQRREDALKILRYLFDIIGATMEQSKTLIGFGALISAIEHMQE